MTASTTTVLGAAGGMGRVFVERLVSEGIRVIGIDVREQDVCERLVRLVGDVSRPDVAIREAIASADSVVVCVPEPLAVRSLPAWAPALTAGALVVDTLSAKSRFAAQACMFAAGAERLGINPLFAPDLAFRGRSAAIVRVAGGPRTEWFLGLLRRWGLTLVELTPDEHDHAMSLIQALTHATVLAFGCALRECGYDATASAPLRTPPHAVLLSLLARMLENPPGVYLEIQRANDHAGRARAALLRGVERVGVAVAADDASAFERLLCDMRGCLGAELFALSERARRSFAV